MATGQAKNRHVDFCHLRVVYCTVVAIWTYLVIYNWFSCIWTFLRERTWENFTSHWISRWINQFFLAVFKGLFCAREMHSTTKFAMLFLSKCVFSSVSCIVLLCFAKQADFLTKFQKLWPYEKAWVMTNDCLFQPTLGHHMMLCIVNLTHKQVLVQFPQITVCHAAVLWLWSWIISIFQRLSVSTAFPALSRKWKKLALRQLERFHEFIRSSRILCCEQPICVQQQELNMSICA